MTKDTFLNRNFYGYGPKKPEFVWPQGKRVALSIVVNIEEGAELTLSSGDEKNEYIYENNLNPVSNQSVDLCMESHFEYGLRAGIWRVFHLLDQFKVKVTFSCCSRALKKSPWLVKEIISRGHEISAHSVRWETHSNFSVKHEKNIINECYNTILELAGEAPIGWHTRSATSVNTRRLLIEHGGFLYDSNSYNDDLPYSIKKDNNKFIILPYSFDTNDMRFEQNGGFVHSNDFFQYCKDTIDRLIYEGQKNISNMMSIGLHPRIIGRPGRIKALYLILNYIKGNRMIWVSRRKDIAQFWADTNL